MNDGLPLSALLSQAWVAFTIEFDNEFEYLVPHRTTNHGFSGSPSSSPWLVFMVMWLQFMRFVDLLSRTRSTAKIVASLGDHSAHCQPQYPRSEIRCL
jgi:hypothetical protein